MAIAEHNPGALNAKNKGLANLPKSTLHEFAATPEKGLPGHVAKPSAPSRMKVRMKPKW